MLDIGRECWLIVASNNSVPINMDKHKAFMTTALAESKQALPICLPNPPVGCVLVQNDKIVARGFTQAPGSDHAEAAALRSYHGSLKNVSAYVTLEPCSFHGRTPSCAKLFIECGIECVYVAMQDPDPRNSGKGFALLKDAGIDVFYGILGESVNEFLSPYLIGD